MTNGTFRSLRIEKREDNAAIIWLDVPDVSVNTLQADFAQDFNRVLEQLSADKDLEVVVLASAKEDFIAGADIKMLTQLPDAEAARQLSRTAQQAMDQLEAFPLPIVAAIHGVCLGGGLEVALACRGRVATNSARTRLGQPEVKLGVIPGVGGTQRLPRLVGLETALNMILTGKTHPASKACALGLVDEVVPRPVLLEAALARARELVQENNKEPEAGTFQQVSRIFGSMLSLRKVRSLLLEKNSLGRSMVFNQAKKKVLSHTHGNLPAPLQALEVIKTGMEQGLEAGFKAEVEAFGDLAVSTKARNLMALFLAKSALKKDPGTDEEIAPRLVRKVGVLGAGLMGSGIAYVTAAKARLPVRLKDLKQEVLRQGLRTLWNAVTEQVKKRRMTAGEGDRVLALVRPTTEYTGFKQADVVIEAVVEDLKVKQQVLREVEAHGGPEMIFASNTSSIPIHKIAEASDRPEAVVGMHYFSPVPKVPLLEVIVTEKTVPEVVATCVALGKQQNKTVIVVRDGAGFYTTRILAPYINEATHLLAEGVSIQDIDKALVNFGFPVGPLKLLDEVGIDVVQKIAHILEEAFGERMKPTSVLAKLVSSHRLGKKNGQGLYRYQKMDGIFKGKGKQVDQSVYQSLGIKPDKKLEANEIAMRCLLPMINEAVHCYHEGILRSARDGDVGAVFGLGFPPFLGGPFRFIDNQGLRNVSKQLVHYQEQFGKRFTPASLLVDLAQQGIGFYDENVPPPGKTLS
ncbi:short chain enoyl-CoA hydratase / 3-hydroxyacyl-CoA dehydrogenase [Nitrosococcus oceani ATCC 19707]|uniref:enoyl-CoA hydratase n=2 Tax=Nitrosococcus oceani TaxID=1229 RepID=Q3JAE1_NITOC|nr:fatty acid oxidation complex subunit alpha FadJ [Nitrosococcus oceani]ABA58205.1 short chain enoyl-CoA hydratase / 3-hydroxyacyl-CoA dehydrogenase [Nitrosococcus oceani ATCC 19707]EDZ67500.1 3-hydroxyacyl-CoA dehydrogenase, C-terminal domain family [Nitrosococcus oceani AFC27]KFI19318.1 multifunctional fatty acid oxidation complex subunit alpha [Nitrosococcus oceani C-27]GEM20425.1 multifunctional fatty acid oxidation complex subunit alpha [Nitrosococcus oceani]